MPSTPSGPGPRGRPRGGGRPGPGRDVRLTRALVGVVLAVLLLVTLVTALRGEDPADGAGPAGAGAGPAAAARPGEASGGGDGGGETGSALDAPSPVLAPLADLRAAAGAPPPSAAGLAAALDPLLADPALGPRVGAAVVDAATGDLLWAAPAPGDGLVVPASTAKLVTGAAALAALGGDHRLATRVVAGSAPGEVVLVGGGDPTLAGPAADPAVRHGGTPPARLTALADATASALAESGTGAVPRLLVDATLFAPPEPAPGWLPGDLSAGYVGPVSALAVDAGRVRPDRRPRHAQPDLAAGAAFAALLAERGHPVGEVVRGAAPPAAAVLAEAESPPVAALVETMLLGSDNDLAEALARHVALARGLPADPAGVAAALPAAVAGLGVPPEAVPVTDGSGLSRASRVRPAALAGLVAAAASPARPGLRPVVTGLPTAGFGGTLAERYDGTGSAPAAGRAWAKTGTLTGTSALAGLVVDAEGRLLAFDVTADAVPAGGTLAAEAALDRAVAALAACGCTG